MPAAAVAGRCGSAYTFTVIADSTVGIGGGNYLDLEAGAGGGQHDADGIWPAIDVSGVVAFRSGFAGGYGIFTGEGVPSEVRTLVLDRNAHPSSDFTYLLTPPAIATVNNSWHGVAFRAVKEIDSVNVDGIFRARFGHEPETITLVGYGNPFPPVSNEPDIRANGDVLFFGGSYAMVSSSAYGSYQTLFDYDTDGIYGSNAVANISDVAFIGSFPTSGNSGIYRYRSGAILELWSPDDELGPLYPAISDNSVCTGGFIAVMVDDWMNGNRLLYRLGESAYGRTILVDGNADGLDMYPVTAVDGNGCAVFLAYDPVSYMRNIYVADGDGPPTILVERFTSLCGGTAMDLQLYKHAMNSRGQIAFWADLGSGRRVIIRADPVSRPCLTDLDENWETDGSDLAAFAAAFGSSHDDANFNSDADFDDSGDINMNDLYGFTRQFGAEGCGL